MVSSTNSGKYCFGCGQPVVATDAPMHAAATAAASSSSSASINTSYRVLDTDGEPENSVHEASDLPSNPGRRGRSEVARPPRRGTGWNTCIVVVSLAALIGILFATGVISPSTFSKGLSPGPEPAPYTPDPSSEPSPGPAPSPSPSPGTAICLSQFDACFWR